MRYGSTKVTQMPPVYAANLVANSGNTVYGVDVIVWIIISYLCTYFQNRARHNTNPFIQLYILVSIYDYENTFCHKLFSTFYVENNIN